MCVRPVTFELFPGSQGWPQYLSSWELLLKYLERIKFSSLSLFGMCQLPRLLPFSGEAEQPTFYPKHRPPAVACPGMGWQLLCGLFD